MKNPNPEKIKSLLTKKEQELVRSGTVSQVKFHSPQRLKKYINLARKYRNKYRDLTQRQVVKLKHSPDSIEPIEERGLRTDEKVKIFNTILNRYEKRYESIQGDQT